MLKKCLLCKKEYSIKPSHFEKSFYCSRECFNNDYKNRFSGEKNPNYKNKGIKVCEFCKKDYHTYNKNRKFCSVECSNKYKKENKKIAIKVKIKKIKKIYKCISCNNAVKRKIKTCKDCKDLINKKNNPLIKCKCCNKEFIAYIKSKKVFCSAECRLKLKRISFTGKNNPKYIDGRKDLKQMIRDSRKNKENINSVLKRDNYQCIKCKSKDSIQTDHIVKFILIYNDFIKTHSGTKEQLFEQALNFKPFWDLNNLVTLCKKCNWEKELKWRKENLLITNQRQEIT